MKKYCSKFRKIVNFFDFFHSFYLKHRYLLSEQYRRVYGTTDGGLKQTADRTSPNGQDENSIRAPHFIYGNEFNHLFGNDLDTLQNVFQDRAKLNKKSLFACSQILNSKFEFFSKFLFHLL